MIVHIVTRAPTAIVSFLQRHGLYGAPWSDIRPTRTVPPARLNGERSVVVIDLASPPEGVGGAAGDSMHVAFNWRDQGDFRLLQDVQVSRYHAKHAVGVALSIGEYAVQSAPAGSPSPSETEPAKTAYPSGTPHCWLQSAALGAATIASNAAVDRYYAALATLNPEYIAAASTGVLLTGVAVALAADAFISCIDKY